MTFSPIDAGSAAYDELQAWLDAEGLATSDLQEGSPRFFRLAGPDGLTQDVAGIVGEGTQRLLRSVVISPSLRRSGVGARLLREVENWARADGATSLWLLTQGAAAFFARLGYGAAERSDAPPVIRETSQFQGLCPASAALLCKTLR